MSRHRPNRAELVEQLWHEQPGLYRGYLVDTITALFVGILLVIGGRQRTQAPAWDVVNANGGPAAWGMAFAVAGVLLAIAALTSPRLITWTLWVLAGMYVILAASFLVSVLRDPEGGGSFIGTVLAARAAFMHLSRAQAYREGPRWTE